ncbi:hypothetical protein E1B28_003732 [Marasmius oreades]|uniref:Uncharacterized protein n=1 Tax=Marasmius oreades TaxID=181124 RepID=A0A9P8ABX8_9AGAR|nr:uncharacterized protein E1B28_003732 [Marasmius oreades]KAG7096285.1 hypothetical protein E1B28_003732 [Marasmius oreades]
MANAQLMFTELEKRIAAWIPPPTPVMFFPGAYGYPASLFSPSPFTSIPNFPTAIHANSSHPAPVMSHQICPSRGTTGSIDYYARVASKSTPLPKAPFNLTIPKISRQIPTHEAWKQVIKDWDEPDESRGLTVALKDWEEEWYKNPSVAALYHARQKIALEFIGPFDRNIEEFCKAYPGYERGISALHDAIHAKQKAASFVKSRYSKYQREV